MRSRAHAAAIAMAIAAAFAAALGGCAIRYDKAGVTRVGIGLWGFGDPPGVDWNLDWPRAEVPDLPATAPSELPPRRAPRDLDAPCRGSKQQGPPLRSTIIASVPPLAVLFRPGAGFSR
jgi:hypothetical protein